MTQAQLIQRKIFLKLQLVELLQQEVKDLQKQLKAERKVKK